MKKLTLLLLVALTGLSTYAQKQPLDHSVYDRWQSIGKIELDDSGAWVAYSINVQEGDDTLIVQSTTNGYKKIIPRAYDVKIIGDGKWLAGRIKPFYNAIRQAKIKKKKEEDMPRDTAFLLELGKEDIQKYPDLISFKVPEEKKNWLAVLLKNKPTPKPKYQSDKSKDSLLQVIDSLEYVIKNQQPASDKREDAPGKKSKNNRLLVIKPGTANELTFRNVGEYTFDKNGNTLLLEQTPQLSDTNHSTTIIFYDLNSRKTDTLLKGGNDFKNLALSDDGSQAAFVAERGAGKKDLVKLYKLWYYQKGMDSAMILVDTSTKYLTKGTTVSEFARLKFSKSGKRLLFGTAEIPHPKDTTIADIDKVELDIWNYKDDYLQPYQLKNRKRDMERSYTAVYAFEKQKMMQIGSKALPITYTTEDGDGKFFTVITDTGRRIPSQWEGNTRKDIYLFDVENERLIPAVKNLNGEIRGNFMEPSGQSIIWYDHIQKNYFSFDGLHVQNITSRIKTPLYDEENDVPDDPSPYGIMGWLPKGNYVYIYDRYDIWKVDISGKQAPENITRDGRQQQIIYRYVKTNDDEIYLNPKQSLLTAFNHMNKRFGLVILKNDPSGRQYLKTSIFENQPYYFANIQWAKDAQVFSYTKENYVQSPNVFVNINGNEKQFSSINPQQQYYNWGTASLYNWNTFSGKKATGILYKPENFDSTKKYPVLLYFYEKLSDNLYRYIPPAPTPSRLNISFFVSRGYIVLTPDISYTIGHPMKSAYDYIVSGAKSLTKYKWVNKDKMGLQGQSWGGIQTAHLITMTPMFAAAWAGAPVANMTSAYGGIRWSSGINRQFQYEKTQSRLGATLWQKPELYLENSPLFHLPEVKTPLVIMANDNDGSVPWYQGIELFTGLRRLGKKVWMLNYNKEDHNLVERKNRKDISIREQQYFDWLLKDEKPAKWLTEGVPAVDKGNMLGLELEDDN